MLYRMKSLLLSLFLLMAFTVVPALHAERGPWETCYETDTWVCRDVGGCTPQEVCYNPDGSVPTPGDWWVRLNGQFYETYGYDGDAEDLCGFYLYYLC